VVQGQKSGIQRKEDPASQTGADTKEAEEKPPGAKGAEQAAQKDDKKQVSEPGEPAEQEADAVAEQVSSDLHDGAKADGGAKREKAGDPAKGNGPEGAGPGTKADEKQAAISAKLDGVGRKVFRAFDDKKGSKQKVDKPVPGLYGKLDPLSTPPGWVFKDIGPRPDPQQPSLLLLRTDVVDPKGKEGFVERGYDPVKKQFVMKNAFLITPGEDKGTGVQSMIEHEDPMMIQGRGTPTQTFLTLRQMKVLEQKAGMNLASLEKIKMSTIQNIEGICQLNQALRKGAKPDDLMTNNESRRYAETTLTQAGKKIKSAKVVGGTTSPFKVLLEHYEKGDQKKKETFDKLLGQYGLTRNDTVLWNYDIEFEVMPFDGASK
jgi:hypothetical protein